MPSRERKGHTYQRKVVPSINCVIATAPEGLPPIIRCQQVLNVAGACEHAAAEYWCFVASIALVQILITNVKVLVALLG